MRNFSGGSDEDMAKTPSRDFAASALFQQRLSDALAGEAGSNADIAGRMGISKDVLIRALRAGLIPGTRSLIKIADYTGSSVDFLLGLTDTDCCATTAEGATFQGRLQELARRRGVKYGRIAADIGISRSLFNAWAQNGYIPSAEIAYQLALYFSVSLDYLLGRTDAERYARP